MRLASWAAIAIGAGLLVLLGYVEGRDHGDDSQLNRQVASALQLHRSWSTRVDSLLRRPPIAPEKHAADGIAVHRDSLIVLLPRLAGVRDSAETLARIVPLDAQEIAQLRAALSRVEHERDDFRAALVAGKAVSDSLAAALIHSEEARRCYLVHAGPLKVGCPSRKLSAALGASVVLIVRAAIHTRRST